MEADVTHSLQVGYDEKAKYKTELMAASQTRPGSGDAKFDAESYFKVLFN